jgi:hypothetical protein
LQGKMSSNRRKFMKLAGATAAVAGGWGRNTGCGSDARSVPRLRLSPPLRVPLGADERRN